MISYCSSVTHAIIIYIFSGSITRVQKIYLIKKELRILIYKDPMIMNFAFNIDNAIETEQKRKVVKALCWEQKMNSK